MKEIYFDSAATTRPSKSVIEKTAELFGSIYGNPSSLHRMGLAAEQEIKKAAKALASALQAAPEELLFTSGGTESNNLAILGAAHAYRRRGNHIITTEIEHPSVRDAVLQLVERGFEATFLKVDEKGCVNFQQLENDITENTVMVSIIGVSNETGTIQDLESAGKLIKEKNPETLFHVDGVQAFGKERIFLKKSRIDLFSFSGHKIHGIKGSGGLYVKKGVRLSPLFFGGGQQKKLRPGTENTAAIAALGLAAEESFAAIEENRRQVIAVKHTLLSLMRDWDQEIYVNGDPDGGSPYILNMSFGGIRGEVLLHCLEDNGIYVSTGAACSLGAKEESVVNNLGIDGRANSAVRFSFSRENTVEEALFCAEVLKKNIPVLRRYVRH